MFVDFHVHPNLPSANADSWLNKWWANIARVKLNALVITEHAYKNPERAYTEMIRSQPSGSKVIVLPGVEALTKEGIDVLAFAETDKIYDYNELTTPRALDMDELLDFFAKRKDVMGIIAHPFTPGTTSIITHKGEEYTRNAINKVGAVEVHNGAMLGVMKALEQTGLSVIFPEKYSRAKKTFELPKAFYPKKARLIAAGSDAHHPDGLGAGIKFNAKWNSRADAFRKIASAHCSIIRQESCHPYRDMFTAFSEWRMKQWH